MDSIGLVNAVLMLGAFLVLGGIISSLVASRIGAPLLLVFLLLGMLVGEDGPGGLAFQDYQATYLVGSVALAIILFDGGLRTKAARIRGALAPALLLATLGVVITAALVGLFAQALFELSTLEALLLGSIVASTDAAAVFFLLRTGGLQLKPRVGAVLDVESATNDPIAVFLTVLLTSLILATPAGEKGSEIVVEILRQASVGTFTGIAGGLTLFVFINRVQLPSGLYPLLVVASAVALYGLTALLGGSGFLAVYLAGLILGNRPIRAYPTILSFLDAATWLCQIVMFLMLGLLVTPTKLIGLALPALAVAIFLIVVARPAAVWLCLQPFRFSAREKGFVAWVGLRGAVSIFLAAIPTLAGVPHAEIYFNMAFFVVLVSLLVQGWTIPRVAERLGIARRETMPETARIELDIPGQFEQELVGYPVIAGSLALERESLPDWARPVLVVRGKATMNPIDAGPFRIGDYAFVLAPTAQVDRLDRLFSAPYGGPLDRPALGEFALYGDASIDKLAELYGLDADVEERGFTVAELFALRLGDRPLPGDHIFLGTRAVLVVRRVENDRVTRAGLQLDELVASVIAAARLRTPEALTRAIDTATRSAVGAWRRFRR